MMLYILVSLGVALITYYVLTTGIVSRLRVADAPKSAFGLVRADKFSSDEDVRAHGIEQVCSSRLRFCSTNQSIVSSSSMDSALILIRLGDQRIATLLATFSHKTSPKRLGNTLAFTFTTTIRTGDVTLCSRGYRFSERVCSTISVPISGERTRYVCFQCEKSFEY
jgi:hypothetical protein